jgi:hypothetical protein
VSNQPIIYAAALSPSGEKELPSMTSLKALKVTSLIQGEVSEPIADSPKKKKTGKRKQTKKTPKKAAKQKKTSKDDDLANIDPEVDEFLNDEVMGEEVDAARADLSEKEQADEEPAADEPTNISADNPVSAPSTSLKNS